MSPTLSVRTQSVRALLVSAALAAAPLAAFAGPLTPPAGAPGSTMKTLDQVEARTPLTFENAPGDATTFFKITAGGSYYLTGNLFVTGDMSGILVNAPDVTIDLNGFTIVRASGSTTKALVRAGGAGFTNVTVKNGTIKNAGGHGIDLYANSRVENVTVVAPGQHGIFLGARSVVSNAIVDDPGTDGVNSGADSLVSDTVVYSPGQHGISVSTNSVVRACQVQSASQNGFNVASGTLVQDSTASNCVAFGIAGQANTGTLRVLSNTVTNCGSGGIRVYHSSQIVGNTVSVSGLAVPGITVFGDGSRIEKNVVHGGPDAVRIDASGDDNLVIGNLAQNPTSGNGFANVNAANNQIGPIVTAGGTISSTSPFANFSH